MFASDNQLSLKEVKNIAEVKKKSRAAYVVKYVKANYQRYEIRLNNVTDRALIDHLDQQQNKNDYIKQLIRDDLAK